MCIVILAECSVCALHSNQVPNTWRLMRTRISFKWPLWHKISWGHQITRGHNTGGFYSKQFLYCFLPASRQPHFAGDARNPVRNRIDSSRETDCNKCLLPTKTHISHKEMYIIMRNTFLKIIYVTYNVNQVY